jgi:RHS repeat-associated protein
VDGGYIEGGVYYFYLADHEGNNRVVANASGTVVQTDHYYPFGMPFTEGNATSSQPYKYNGKELDTERGLNLYDYGARLYDPALARWTTVDPLAEKDYPISPYLYCMNNPMIYIDPTGLYKGKSDAEKYAERHGNGAVLQDQKTGQWFVAMDETGTMPYTSGGTLTRYFGPEGDYTSSGMYSNIGFTGTIGGTVADRFGSILRNRGAYFPERNIPSSVNIPIIVKTPIININTTSKVLKAARIGGKAMALAGLAVTGIQVYDDFSQEKKAKAGARIAVAATAVGSAFIPVVGWGVSLGIGVADYVWGDDFYNWVDEKMGGN